MADLTRAEVEALAQLARGGALMGAERHAIADALDAYAATFPPQATPTCDLHDEESGCWSMCHATRDGECHWKDCPQEANGRANWQAVCPLDRICRVHASAEEQGARAPVAALAAAAHKAALEAEARVAEMREQLTKARRWLEIARDCAAGLYDEPEGWPPHKDDPLFWFNGLTRYIEDMAALPSPSSDRFMRLLEAVRAHENHWLPLDVRNALAAFPQPEKQP